MEDPNKIIDEINQRFKEEFWLDFIVSSFQNGNFHIKASIDFDYYHLLEIELKEVCYFHGPMSWGSSPNKKPVIELLADSEKFDLASAYGFDIPRFIFSFNSDAFRVIVGANSIQSSFDVVYYYLKENLGPNQRIDEDVLRAIKGGSI